MPSYAKANEEIFQALSRHAKTNKSLIGHKMKAGFWYGAICALYVKGDSEAIKHIADRMGVTVEHIIGER